MKVRLFSLLLIIQIAGLLYWTALVVPNKLASKCVFSGFSRKLYKTFVYLFILIAVPSFLQEGAPVWSHVAVASL